MTVGSLEGLVVPSNEIQLSGLVKSFKGPDGPIRAVRGVSVQIAAGETVALLGPNGAGKSTTIDMLLGLLHPDEGSVSIFGRSAGCFRPASCSGT
jgi:ABC-2 type transport system ATP-binding protein